MARDDLHFRLRIPEALKARIEQSADANRRSMTAEIVARLEESLDSDPVEALWRRTYPSITLSKSAIENLSWELATLLGEYRESMRENAERKLSDAFKEWAANIAAEPDPQKRAELLEEANNELSKFLLPDDAGDKTIEVVDLDEGPRFRVTKKTPKPKK